MPTVSPMLAVPLCSSPPAFVIRHSSFVIQNSSLSAPVPDPFRTPMNVNHWYYSEGKETYGPFTAEHISGLIQSGVLTRDHLVIEEGAAQWQNVSASAFATFLPPASTVTLPPRQGAPAPRTPRARQASPAQLPSPKSGVPSWAIPVGLILLAGGTVAWWMNANRGKSANTSSPSARSSLSLAPIARFTFDGPNPEPDTDLRNAPQHDGVLELDGSYEHNPSNNGSRAVLKTPQLDPQAFTVAVRLCADDVSGNHNVLLMAGTRARWLSLQVSAMGQLIVNLSNHRFTRPVGDVTIKAGEWVTLVVSVDGKAGQMVIYVNGKKANSIPLPQDFKPGIVERDPNAASPGSEPDWDKEWTFSDYSSGATFKGVVDELVVFGSVLTEGQVSQLKLGNASSKVPRTKSADVSPSASSSPARVAVMLDQPVGSIREIESKLRRKS